MKKPIFSICCCICLILFGCLHAKHVQKNWQATGGSRADAVVRVSYSYTILEKPVANPDQAQKIAEERCRTWGYTGAQPFGGEIKICNDGTAQGCSSWLVTKEYQCLGKGDSSLTPVN